MPHRHHQNVTCRLLALCLLTFGTHAAQTADIHLQLNGAHGDVVHASLYAADDQDWTTPLRQISGLGGTLSFDDIAPGRYAIQLFVDANGNGRLDVSPRGIPQEAVGFSGNPGLFRGKPDAQNCAFEHSASGSQVAVKLRQHRQAAPSSRSGG